MSRGDRPKKIDRPQKLLSTFFLLFCSFRPGRSNLARKSALHILLSSRRVVSDETEEDFDLIFESFVSGVGVRQVHPSGVRPDGIGV